MPRSAAPATEWSSAAPRPLPGSRRGAAGPSFPRGSGGTRTGGTPGSPTGHFLLPASVGKAESGRFPGPGSRGKTPGGTRGALSTSTSRWRCNQALAAAGGFSWPSWARTPVGGPPRRRGGSSARTGAPRAGCTMRPGLVLHDPVADHPAAVQEVVGIEGECDLVEHSDRVQAGLQVGHGDRAQPISVETLGPTARPGRPLAGRRQGQEGDEVGRTAGCRRCPGYSARSSPGWRPGGRNGPAVEFSSGKMGSSHPAR